MESSVQMHHCCICSRFLASGVALCLHQNLWCKCLYPILGHCCPMTLYSAFLPIFFLPEASHTSFSSFLCLQPFVFSGALVLSSVVLLSFLPLTFSLPPHSAVSSPSLPHASLPQHIFAVHMLLHVSSCSLLFFPFLQVSFFNCSLKIANVSFPLKQLGSWS